MRPWGGGTARRPPSRPGVHTIACWPTAFPWTIGQRVRERGLPARDRSEHVLPGPLWPLTMRRSVSTLSGVWEVHTLRSDRHVMAPPASDARPAPFPPPGGHRDRPPRHGDDPQHSEQHAYRLQKRGRALIPGRTAHRMARRSRRDPDGRPGAHPPLPGVRTGVPHLAGGREAGRRPVPSRSQPGRPGGQGGRLASASRPLHAADRATLGFCADTAPATLQLARAGPGSRPVGGAPWGYAADRARGPDGRTPSRGIRPAG